MSNLRLLWLTIISLISTVLFDINNGAVDVNTICSKISKCNDMETICECDEVTNCDVCNPDSGCTKCINDYFRPNSNDQCMPCSDINGCILCTNTIGCQQCRQDCTLIQNPLNSECGINVCDCGDPIPTSFPTNKPSNNPTLSPSLYPSDNPTQQPTEEQTPAEELTEIFESIFETLEPNFDAYARDAIIDLSIAYGQGGLEIWLYYYGGICDISVHSYRNNFHFHDDGLSLTYEFYNSCHSSVNGFFWINGLSFVEYNEDGLIKYQHGFLFEESDKDYISFYGTTRRDDPTVNLDYLDA